MFMQIVKLTKNKYKQIVNQAREIFENNGLIIFPSDTVYGLAVNALSKKAVDKLFKFKDRPKGQSVSIAVRNLDQAQDYIKIGLNQKKLLNTLLPGPYTIVLSSKQKTVKALEAEDQTLGIRIPDYWFTKELSKAINFPYTSTSANIHSKGPHYSIPALLNTLSAKKKALIDLIIDFGQLPHNSPSTVLNMTENKIKILRQGMFTLKLVNKFISQNEKQTKNIAQILLKKYLKIAGKFPLVFILQGDLGTGKTVFTKGLGEFLGINNIVSPTYVIYYEYQTDNKIITKLHHFDLYKLEKNEDLETLEISKTLKPNNLLVFEWGEKIANAFSMIKNKQAKIILINFKELSINKRDILVYEI